MRVAFVVIASVACGGGTSGSGLSTPPRSDDTGATATDPSASASGDAANESPTGSTGQPKVKPVLPNDFDGDDVVDACDQCKGAETFNGLDDLDGCPDEPSDAVADHPSNRYAAPLVTFQFEGAKPSTTFAKWEIPDDVEALACIGLARDDAELARKRTKVLCDHLRSYVKSTRPKLEIVEVAVSSRPTYRRENGSWYGGMGELRVLRAGGIELWRRDGEQLVQMIDRKTKNPRPVTPACRATPPLEPEKQTPQLYPP